jgi:similar to stage IV sporulation protein
MLKGILKFWRGNLLIEIRGNALERFISQIIASGIALWDLKRMAKDHYLASMYVQQFKDLRPLVKKRMCQVKILEKRGAPFIFKGIKRRIFLVIGLLIFLSIFYLGSILIWSIEINGLKQINKDDLIRILNNSGIRPGILKNTIDTALLERELLRGEPLIAWVNVRWQGVSLYIEIVEKKIVEESAVGNIVADRDGLITEMIILKGQAAVKEGDTVTRGQPLIISDQQQQARGIVKAYVWYESTGLYPLITREVVFTGESRTIWGIGWNDQILWLTRNNPLFGSYQRERQIKRMAKWRNICFPIELIKEKQEEIKIIFEKRSSNIALYLARKEAIKEIFSRIDPAAVILDIQTEVLTDTDEIVMIRILIKTEEDIAVLKGDFNGSN